MTMKPRLLYANDSYFERILKWQGLLLESAGQIYKLQNADLYNYLVDINKVFSQAPKGQPIDRTGFAFCPVKFHVDRAWRIPTQQKTLDQALKARVLSLAQTQEKINVFWSGGIDSTTMVTAFLKHLDNKSQLRILYTPWSIYEHPGYIDFIKKFQSLEIIDISGTVYMDTQFDGIFLTGDGGDEFSASLDESFFIKYGYDALFGSWKDFFYQHNPNDKFINFCENHFAQSGRDISTVLEARWWFYVTCKNASVLHYSKLPYFVDYKNFSPDIVQSFYDCEEYEEFIYWNTDQIMGGPEYTTWKQHFKSYCYQFDRFEDWYKTKGKFNSNQTVRYLAKKTALKNLRFLMILSDGTVVKTPNLPFVTHKEYQEHCSQIDYLFDNDN